VILLKKLILEFIRSVALGVLPGAVSLVVSKIKAFFHRLKKKDGPGE